MPSENGPIRGCCCSNCQNYSHAIGSDIDPAPMMAANAAAPEVPLSITFGAGFDAGFAGTTEEAVVAAAQEAWGQWLRYMYVDRLPQGNEFNLEIVSGSQFPDCPVNSGVAAIYFDLLDNGSTPLQQELLSGVDSNGAEVDATIALGPGFSSTSGGSITAVLAHEIGHALGFVNSGQFAQQTSGASFVGTNAVSYYGGPVPTDTASGHLAGASHANMTGSSLTVAPLDAYVLADLGYPIRVDGSYNAAPIAGDEVLVLAPGEAFTFNPTANDVDPDGDGLYTQLTSFPEQGVSNNQDGTYTYFGNGGVGTDYFEYQVTDGFGGIGTGRVFVTIGAGGTAANDTIMGGSRSDLLTGAFGDDSLVGSSGDDLVFGNQGFDLAYGNQGADTVFGGQEADTLFGGQDADIIYGNFGADIVYGNLAADLIYGGQGADTLYGGQGDDVLFGNVGDDVLFPGLGADTIQPGGGGNDTVIGFDGDGGDRLALSGLAWSLGSTTDGDAILSYEGGSITLAGLSSSMVSSTWVI